MLVRSVIRRKHGHSNNRLFFGVVGDVKCINGAISNKIIRQNPSKARGHRSRRRWTGPGFLMESHELSVSAAPFVRVGMTRPLVHRAANDGPGVLWGH